MTSFVCISSCSFIYKTTLKYKIVYFYLDKVYYTIHIIQISKGVLYFMRAILLGLYHQPFFRNFIINRAMNVSGTSWAWTASFRFYLLSYFIPYRFISQKLKGLWEELKKHPLAWIGWGSVAGIGFYSLLSFAAVFSPAWLVAGTWQVTILAGLLLSPLFFVKIETKSGNETCTRKNSTS